MSKNPKREKIQKIVDKMTKEGKFDGIPDHLEMTETELIAAFQAAVDKLYKTVLENQNAFGVQKLVQWKEEEND